jgi:hypothetical protein
MSPRTLAVSAAILRALAATAQGQSAPDGFTDRRDGYAYRTVTIGGLRWFAENLRFKTANSGCYESDEANDLTQFSAPAIVQIVSDGGRR